MSSHKPKTTTNFAHHANFIEARQGIVKDTAKSLKDDLIKGTANQMVDTIFNRGSQENSENENKESFDFNEFMHSSEAANKQRHFDRVKYEYDQVETVIFNRRQQEIEKKIEQIQLELKNLAHEVVVLDETTQTVIQQEIVDPGVYHLNFFERLLNFVVQLRKRVAESRNWAALHQHRGKAKSYFWQQSNKKVGGTKFMLSQERQVATQTG